MEHCCRRINGMAVGACASSQRILVHPFVSEVPDLLAAVKEKFHTDAASRNVFLLLDRHKWKPAPQLFLPFGFIFYDGHGERSQGAIDHYFAVCRFEHHREPWRLANSRQS